MKSQDVFALLDDSRRAAARLHDWGLRDVDSGRQAIAAIADSGLPMDLMTDLCRDLGQHLPGTAEPDLALKNLSRFISAARSPLALASLLQRDEEALPVLLRMFSSSQLLSDLLIDEPETYDLLRVGEGEPVAREILEEDIRSEMIAAGTNSSIAKALIRRFRRREMMRIAYGAIVRQQRLETVTSQLTYLADAVCQAAFTFAEKELSTRYGKPRTSDNEVATLSVIAWGRLGGGEQDFTGPRSLFYVYTGDGQTDGPKGLSNREFFQRVCHAADQILQEESDLGSSYALENRLATGDLVGTSPPTSSPAQPTTIDEAIRSLDRAGQTWQRHAFVKARPVAGDIPQGLQFLERLQNWVYRSVLSKTDIDDIRLLKRRFEQQFQDGSCKCETLGDLAELATRAVRQIELVVPFLQLVNGADLAKVRVVGTLDAIIALEQVGCLTMDERTILESNYQLLRKLEHVFQLSSAPHAGQLDPQAALRSVAIRLGIEAVASEPLSRTLQSRVVEATTRNRDIVNHLLGDTLGQDDQANTVMDLVLHPHPESHTIQEVLRPYSFSDVPAAYANLLSLSRERSNFLSPRRCRHFLASIAKPLLTAIAQTPLPDKTLRALADVSDSLGGKAVLWELFQVHEPTMELCVRLCATSPYLIGILTSNPGMIDELMDSLVLDQLPTQQELHGTLERLCRGADEIGPIVASFKNSMHLRIGVRDILGKLDIVQAMAALSDVAVVCLQQITTAEFNKLAEKYGTPTRTRSDGKRCEFVVLGMGKLGAGEPNYHSDLDVVFLYEEEGTTQPKRSSHRTSTTVTTNQHFFSELAQRVIHSVSQFGPYGRLFEMDPPLRPTGVDGPIAVSFRNFAQRHTEGRDYLAERQAFCQARAIYGSPTARQTAIDTVQDVLRSVAWDTSMAERIWTARVAADAEPEPINLKRSPGGTMDIECAVQLWQLRHAHQHIDLVVPGTLAGIQTLCDKKIIDSEAADHWTQAYRFLRHVESRLRLMNTTGRHELPTDPASLAVLAYLLNESDPDIIIQRCQAVMTENRQRLSELVESLQSS